VAAVSLRPWQQEFIALAVQQGALKFGEFTLKSGRVSPYFFNAGAFSSGAALAQLGRCYAAAIMASDLRFDMLFGPAYKGIPLVSAIAIALADRHGKDCPWAFNRKEAKDHGEGGQVVGAPLQGRVLVVDDVITAGTAIREAANFIRDSQATLAGVMVALDRQERGTGATSAVQDLEQKSAICVQSIIGMNDLIGYLEQTPDLHSQLKALTAYRQEYGIDV